MDRAYYTPDFFRNDALRAIDAKFEAQKIAFSPLTFQAVRALLELGLLRAVEDAGDGGISPADLAERTGVSSYGVAVLCEMALGMGVLKLAPAGTEAAPSAPVRDSSSTGGTPPNPPVPAETSSAGEERYVLGKTGWMLLEDDLTRVNFNFVNDICYKGAFDLVDSVRNGRPEGLRQFAGQWTTIYEALSSLPAREKKSWFDFDHFYSDIAFPEALPIVFASRPRSIVDIGGNTAKWAVACCRYDPDVRVTIVDLPGQTAVAERNAAEAGFADRIATRAGNILDDATALPESPDAVWMSQFLDCFSLAQVTRILRKVFAYAGPQTDVYVLEPLWDRQRFVGESYALQATSLYFTCMANGNSKMYRYGELVQAVEAAGFSLRTAHHNLGSNSYSLLVFRK